MTCTGREIWGISGIYFWSKLCTELGEQRWEVLRCLRTVRSQSGVSMMLVRAEHRARHLGCPSFVRSPRGDVLLALPTPLLHEGKGCSGHPQVVFTMAECGITQLRCPQMPGYHLLPIHPICGLVLPGSRSGQGSLSMTAAHLFFPSFILCLFLFGLHCFSRMSFLTCCLQCQYLTITAVSQTLWTVGDLGVTMV